MATIKYLIQSQSETAGIYVRLRVGHDLIDVKAKTKYIVDAKNWDNKAGEPLNKNKDAGGKKLHSDLIRLKADLLDHYNAETNKANITTQWLKDFVNPPIKDTKNETEGASDFLVKYYDTYLKDVSNEVGETTKRKFKVHLALLERFETYSKTNYKFTDINKNFANKLTEYCQAQNYAQNTIAQLIKSIKTVCYHAKEFHGKTIPDNLKKQLKPNFEKRETVNILNTDELAILEKTIFTNERLDRARDWLLISCEVGQRVSDLMRLNKDLIYFEDKKPYIEIRQEKTKKLVSIPLNDRVMKILKKRGGEFPVPMIEQDYNEAIKTVGDYAGLHKMEYGSVSKPIMENGKEKLVNGKKQYRKETGYYKKYELLVSHIGRRSFASNYYGILPTAVIKAITAHATEQQLLIYIGKTDKELAKQAHTYFKKISIKKPK